MELRLLKIPPSENVQSWRVRNGQSVFDNEPIPPQICLSTLAAQQNADLNPYQQHSRRFGEKSDDLLLGRVDGCEADLSFQVITGVCAASFNSDAV